MRQILSAVRRRLFAPSETIEGYEQPELVDVIFRKTQAYRPTGRWPEIAGASSVLDFGGGCGQHYKQAQSATVRWAVVDTPTMVERAKELSTDNLRFFTDIAEAAGWLGVVDVMHSDGAIQYTPHPQRIVEQLCNLHAKKLLWYRLFLGDPEQELQSSLLSENGPGSIPVREKAVRYLRTRIPEPTFLDAHAGYLIEARGPDWFRFVRGPE